MDQIAIVDVTDQSVKFLNDDKTEYGRGLAVKLLKKYMSENVMVIAPGLLTGTPVPCATRATIVAKGKEDKKISVSNISGDFPQKLASIHLSALVIKGSCKNPNTVIYLEEEKISFWNLPQLQGKYCKEVVSYIREKWGNTCAVIGRGPASDYYYPVSSLFVTYPHGIPEFSCPRSSTGVTLAKMGIRAIVLQQNKYFQGSCKDRDGLLINGKKLAQYILKDPICGEALPGLGSITLLHLLKNKSDLKDILKNKNKEKRQESRKNVEKINYSCAPMCVIGCLNKHNKGNSNIYSSPEESEIQAATKTSFQNDMSDENLKSCTSYLSQTGMEIGVNMIELIYAMRLYFDAVKEQPSFSRIKELVNEVENGTVLGRILAGGTRRVCEIFSDHEEIQEKVTKQAVTKEKEHKLKINTDLLYQEIFLFENFGICIFSSFALLNKKEPLCTFTELFRNKTGKETTLNELLKYSQECLTREEELWKELNLENNIKSIPEFVKVLYTYFENSENNI
ncbi:MAG: aldehyde ferredoxin oxidoreductase N-terminal domain-containing protein [Finegoldia sp.]|nr:aldehyde ferredoxin oxidoreductase N-terminal domain-containing protein [Finegoldia sp.]